MVWIPSKKTLKILARTKRRRRRRRVARVFLFIGIIFVLTSASVATEHDLMVQVDAVTANHQFDFVNWISLAAASEVKRQVVPYAVPVDPLDQRLLVDTYLEQEAEIRRLKQEINRIYAGAESPRKAGDAAAPLEQDLAQQKKKQAQLIPQVETIISRQIEVVLKEEGFSFAGKPFPPVAFRLVNPPTALILSPRDKIERKHFFALEPGLDTATRTEIEETLHRRGDISSYITNVGGLGSYPTMVVGNNWLPWLVETTAHEWTHNYLYTFPTNIAWGYGDFPRLTTINETTASLVGQEIGRKVITRFYPDWVDKLPPLNEQGEPEPREPSEFQLAMRRIRQTVDELLADGKIEEAEAFMEEERVKLVGQGHNLRRLNQAYFAFHGSYALSPASIDPTRAQNRQPRAGRHPRLQTQGRARIHGLPPTSPSGT